MATGGNMTNIDALILELEQETKATRGLLHRIPEDRLAWKPHSKSMTLGQLGMHVASIPGRVSELMHLDGMDSSKATFTPPVPESKTQILETFETAIEKAKQNLSAVTQEKAMSPWRLSKGDQEVFSIPRIGVARTMLLNHWYHHRGQLTVYLRLLDVPLPVTYGRSADENPFAS